MVKKKGKDVVEGVKKLANDKESKCEDVAKGRDKGGKGGLKGREDSN